jgi:hypothetical protein
MRVLARHVVPARQADTRGAVVYGAPEKTGSSCKLGVISLFVQTAPMRIRQLPISPKLLFLVLAYVVVAGEGGLAIRTCKFVTGRAAHPRPFALAVGRRFHLTCDHVALQPLRLRGGKRGKGSKVPPGWSWGRVYVNVRVGVCARALLGTDSEDCVRLLGKPRGRGRRTSSSTSLQTGIRRETWQPPVVSLCPDMLTPRQLAK